MRPVLHLLALLLGAMVGVAATAVHRDVLLGLPVGLVLAVTTSLLVAWLLRGVGQSARLASSYSLGWVLVVGTFVAGRPEGDYLVASDGRGYLLLATGFALVVLGVVSLAARAPRSRGSLT